MKILILAPMLHGRVVENLLGNPGIGGTEYVTLKLAHELSYVEDFEVECLVGPDNNFSFETELSFIEHVEDVNAYDIAVVPCAYIHRKIVDYKSLAKLGRRLICVSHHPHDDVLKLKLFHTLVSLSTYQYFSNNLIPVFNQWHVKIPNIFDDIISDSSQKNNEMTEVVYLGALIPAKGFIELAKEWNNIKSLAGYQSLSVVGSGDLYIHADLDVDIPCSNKMAKKIRRCFDNAVLPKNIKFHGKVSLDEKLEIIDNSSVAVLNPLGRTEAYPMSPIECFARGVPVVASGDYGFSEVMSRFPELALRHPRDLPRKLEYLSDEYNYRIMSERALQLAIELKSNKNNIVKKWQNLIGSVAEKNPNGLLHLKPHYCSSKPGLLRKSKYFLRSLARSLVNSKNRLK